MTFNNNNNINYDNLKTFVNSRDIYHTYITPHFGDAKTHYCMLFPCQVTRFILKKMMMDSLFHILEMMTWTSSRTALRVLLIFHLRIPRVVSRAHWSTCQMLSTTEPSVILTSGSMPNTWNQASFFRFALTDYKLYKLGIVTI